MKQSLVTESIFSYLLFLNSQSPTVAESEVYVIAETRSIKGTLSLTKSSSADKAERSGPQNRIVKLFFIYCS